MGVCVRYFVRYFVPFFSFAPLLTYSSFFRSHDVPRILGAAGELQCDSGNMTQCRADKLVPAEFAVIKLVSIKMPLLKKERYFFLLNHLVPASPVALLFTTFSKRTLKAAMMIKDTTKS